MRDISEDMKMKLEAARLLIYRAVQNADDGAPSPADASLAKCFANEVAFEVANQAMQVFGASGYSTDLPLEAMYRYARAARLYDGADEVHRQSVARQILRGYEPHDVPSEHVPTRRDEARARFADLLEAVSAND